MHLDHVSDLDATNPSRMIGTDSDPEFSLGAWLLDRIPTLFPWSDSSWILTLRSSSKSGCRIGFRGFRPWFQGRIPTQILGRKLFRCWVGVQPRLPRDEHVRVRNDTNPGSDSDPDSWVGFRPTFIFSLLGSESYPQIWVGI